MESYAKYAKEKLNEHIIEIEKKIGQYLEEDFGKEGEMYHEISKETINLFKDYILRPAKRLRGSFVLEAYKMFANNKEIDEIYKASIAIEMIHAYLLLVDDFNDRSDLRRTLPTGHRYFEKYFKDNKMKGDALHFGYSIETLTGLVGAHHAGNLILDMNLSSDIKIRIMKTINNTVNLTAYGQVRDIYNAGDTKATIESVMKVHEYKTAYYTYHNPIQLGCILAQQPTEVIERFKGYTMPAGIAFQIQDDILGVFGDPKDTGKSNMDDIMEGKATLLTIYAKEHANSSQLEVLERGIGNRELDLETFKKIQNIIIDTGSLEYSKQVALKLVTEAKEHMYNEFSEYKDTEGFKFIVGIADYMIERKL